MTEISFQTARLGPREQTYHFDPLPLDFKPAIFSIIDTSQSVIILRLTIRKQVYFFYDLI